jgi:pyruvate dehydrogenase E2 component (dihydrolipoamide acetyltransferase)
MENLQPAETFIPHHPDGRSPVSPRARRLANEASCDLAGVAGSGPHGRIVERDVRSALAARPFPRRAQGGIEDQLGLRPLPGAPWAPQAHLEADCNLDALERLRTSLNDSHPDASRSDETATKISLVDCVVKALATALQQTPRANILQAQDVFAPALHSNIAMAMAVEGRLATPVLAAAERLTLAEIAAARGKFMAGRFPPAALMAGRFAAAGLGAASSLVIDFGDFGVKRVFPVIVAPWTLVLSIGEAQDRVVVEDGAPAVAAILSVTLTIDRRAMDEIAGAMLLDAFRQLIENPEGLL